MANPSNDLSVKKTVKLYMGGAFPRTESGRSLAFYNPKTQSLYAHLCRASRKDLRNAVGAANAALGTWGNRTSYNRSQILYRMAEMMESKKTEFLKILQEGLGYEKAEAEKNVNEAIDSLVYYSGWADKYQQVLCSINPVNSPHHNFTSIEAVGVVGILSDDTVNFSLLVDRIAATIASGNTTVVFMANQTAPLLASLAEVFATSDLDGGVVNLLSGYLDELYPYFADHMEIHSLLCLVEDEAITADIKTRAIHNMKRVASGTQRKKDLENLSQFVEYKTTWHPIGS